MLGCEGDLNNLANRRDIPLSVYKDGQYWTYDNSTLSPGKLGGDPYNKRNSTPW